MKARSFFALFSILLGAVTLACGGLTISTSQGESESAGVQQVAAINTISPNAAMIATVNAAPIRPTYPPPAVEVAQTSPDSSVNMVTAFDPAVVEAGSASFTAYCSACHGIDAKGVSGLGKDLVNSEFVHSLTNDELMNFVKTGRPIWDAANTTGIDMPPKGGNPGMTDEELLNIITFLRSLDPNYVPQEQEVAVVAESTPEVTPETVQATVTEEAAEVTPEPTEAAASQETAAPAEAGASVEAGAENFVAYCSACHGIDAKGVSGLGKDLVTSEFVHSLTDQDLLNFVKTGRPIWDSANTTGIDMPPKGGNPALTDEQILSIIAYIRSLE